MPPDPDKHTVRRAAVVYSLGTSGKTIDNWLQRDQVTVPSGPTPPGSWRRFAAADIAVFALVLKMVKFGLPVATASGFANTALTNAAADRLPDLASAPPDSIKALGAGLRLLVWREGDEWHMRLDREHEGPPPADAHLVVHLHDVLHRAIGRAFRADAALDRLKARSASSTTKATRRRVVWPKPD